MQHTFTFRLSTTAGRADDDGGDDTYDDCYGTPNEAAQRSRDDSRNLLMLWRPGWTTALRRKVLLAREICL